VGIINTVLGIPLGYVIYFAYWLFGNYGLAIVAFAIIVKLPLFPVMMLAQRNSIKLLQLQPALHEIKQRHAGDKESLNEAQNELFEKEKYSPLLGILPLFVQLLLVVGILQVMYHPLQHMLRMPAGEIEALVAGIGGFAPQLQVFEYVYGEVSLMGLRLTATPSVLNPSIELIMPLLSGLVAFVFCMVQNALSPGALSQSRRTNMGLTIFTVGLSVYFAYALPVGVGLYWTVGNLGAIAVVVLLKFMYPPKKLAAEALAHNQSMRKTPEQVQEEKELRKQLQIREKENATRFQKANKQVVFYAISSGQYKFYKTIIDYLVEHSSVTIHYLTNDPNDAVFTLHISQIVPYYIGQQKMISLMLKLDTDIFVTTVPDLQNFHIKRSIVRDDIEYIHTFHGLASTSLVYREKAFDNFDTLFCVGSHQVAEVRRRETMMNLQKKKLVKVGYSLYDQLVALHENNADTKNEKPRILIAPSWQMDNILETCIDSILELLRGQGYDVVVRPHPQHIKLFPERVKTLVERFSDGSISFELDFFDNKSIYTSDVLITDWSNIGFDFSYSTLKPCIFVNTPMKLMNPNYRSYGIEPLDIILRDKLGRSVEVDEIAKLNELIMDLLQNKKSYRQQIEDVIQQYLFYPGRSGEAGGTYIIKTLEAKMC
jgi:YidC/Oxa1 family membrane protein insertase